MPSRVVTRMSNKDIKSLHREGHRLSLLQVHSPLPEALGSDAWVFRAFRIQKSRMMHVPALQNTPAGSGTAPFLKPSKVSMVKHKRHNKD